MGRRRCEESTSIQNIFGPPVTSQEPLNNNPPQTLGSGAAFFGPGPSPGGGGLTAGALNGRNHLLEAHSGVPNARAGGAALSAHDQAHHLV